MTDKDRGRRLTFRRLLSTIAFLLGIAAVVKELRTPPSRRTWNGIVAGFVPYDFRPPTLDRIRDRMWNEKAPLVTSQAFGVGWTLNLGAVKRMLAG